MGVDAIDSATRTYCAHIWGCTIETGVNFAHLPFIDQVIFDWTLDACFGRRQTLAIIPYLLKALSTRKNLRVVSKVGYLTEDALISPYPQSLMVRWND